VLGIESTGGGKVQGVLDGRGEDAGKGRDWCVWGNKEKEGEGEGDKRGIRLGEMRQ